MKMKSYRDDEDMFQRVKGVIHLLPNIYYDEDKCVSSVIVTNSINIQLIFEYQDIKYARKTCTSFIKIILKVPGINQSVNGLDWLSAQGQTCHVKLVL
jgi:hypothetical protein